MMFRDLDEGGITNFIYPSFSGGNFRGGNGYHMETATGGAEYDFGGTAKGESKSVSFKPLCGILSQGKYLPMMWGGLAFEFELIGDKGDAFADSVTGVIFLTN